VASPRRPATTPARPRADLSLIAFPALLLLLVLAPLERGLFFPSSLLPFIVEVALLALLVAIDRLLRGERLPLTSGLDWAVLAYAVGFALADRLHPAVPDHARQGALLGGMLLLWYWAAAHLVRGAGRVRAFARAVFGSGVLLALLGCLALAGIFPFPDAVQGERILSTLQYANSLAAWLIAASLAGLGLVVEALSHQRTGWRTQTALAAYGAGLALMVLTLLGTYSRGGWIVYVVAVGIWGLGVSPQHRRAAAFVALWSIAVGLLFSRAALDLLGGGHHARGLIVLGVTLLLGALGPAGYRWLGDIWRRQMWAPGVRQALRVTAALYGIGVGIFLLIAGTRAAATAGQGILANSVVQRASSVGLTTPDLLARVGFWRDALRLIRVHPLAGYGAGGWAALYHGVQSSLYWTTQVHESVLQAWVEGGALAALGLAALGLLLLWRGWQRRPDPEGAILWGLAAGGVGLWLHSLVDFDLSLAALAVLLWGVAGAVRGPTAAAAAPSRPRRILWAVGGAVVATALCWIIAAPASRLAHAQALGSIGAAAIVAHQYGTAYTLDTQALALDPLSPTIHADLAQLQIVAYAVDHNRTTLRQATADAQAAAALDPGDLTSRGTAVNVLVQGQQWDQAATAAEALVRDFPLDPQVYDLVGQTLVRVAEGEIGQASFTQAAAVLHAAADLQAGYAAAAHRLGRHSAPPAGPLGPTALKASGQADALLGRTADAATLLTPLAGHGDVEAAAWLAASDARAGDTPASAAALRQAGTSAAAQAALRAARQYLAFTPELQ